MKRTTTKRAGFDARAATRWLLVGALGLSAGATLRLYLAPRAAAPEAVVDTAASVPQLFLTRRSPLRPIARTRAS